MNINLKLVFNALVVLCFAFGIINLVFGFALLYNYFSIQSQISTNLYNLNQSISVSKLLLQNLTSFTHGTSSDISNGTRNITIILNGIDQNITAISQSFHEDSIYFNSLDIPGVNTHPIANSFENISIELYYSEHQSIPRLETLISTDSNQISQPLSNINASAYDISGSITTVLESAVTQISSAEQTISLLVLGFAVYLIIEGAFFLLFGLMLYYS